MAPVTRYAMLCYALVKVLLKHSYSKVVTFVAVGTAGESPLYSIACLPKGGFKPKGGYKPNAPNRRSQ